MTNFRPADTESDQQRAKYRNWDSFGPDEEPQPYVDLIQRDPVVCNTCFLIRYDVLTCEWWRGTFGWSKYEKWTPIHGRSDEIPADTAAQGVRLVCKNCGHNTQERPIPKDRIDEYAQNLSSTLRSKGIEHDKDLLLSEIKRLNKKPEHQYRQDNDVFSPAVKKAIRAKQGWSSITSTADEPSHS